MKIIKKVPKSQKSYRLCPAKGVFPAVTAAGSSLKMCIILCGCLRIRLKKTFT